MGFPVRRRPTLDQILTAQVRRHAQGQAIDAMLLGRGSTPLEQELSMLSGDDVGGGWLPEIPSPLANARAAQLDLESRMPELDFVPDNIHDPAIRRALKGKIKLREDRHVDARRQSNQWGGSVANLQPGQSGTLLRWNNPDGAPVPVTLQLGYTIDGAAITSVPIPGTGFYTNKSTPVVQLATDLVSVYVRVDWGGGGVTNSAFCDLQQGTQLRLTATFVNVSVFYLTRLPNPWPTVPSISDAPPYTGPPITITGMVGRGHPQLNVSGARFTWPVLVPAGRKISADFIPPYASAFGTGFFAAAGPIALNVNIMTQTVNDAQPTCTNFTITDPTPSTDFRYLIPQGGRFIELENTGAKDVTAKLIYSLMMG